MVAEKRFLEFSDDELKEALRLFDRAKLGDLPDGQLLDAKLKPAPDKGDVTIALKIMRDVGTSESHDLSLGRPKLAAVLIHYCMRKGIPLPRAARKHVSLAGEKAVLNLALPPEGEAEKKG